MLQASTQCTVQPLLFPAEPFIMSYHVILSTHSSQPDGYIRSAESALCNTLVLGAEGNCCRKCWVQHGLWVRVLFSLHLTIQPTWSNAIGVFSLLSPFPPNFSQSLSKINDFFFLKPDSKYVLEFLWVMNSPVRAIELCSMKAAINNTSHMHCTIVYMSVRYINKT